MDCDAVSNDSLNVKKVYTEYIDTSCSEKTVNNYSKLAEDYEKDFVSSGYTTPAFVAETAIQHVENSGPSCAFLDVCCGTGLVADGLRLKGFLGSIDGIDASTGMLQVAMKKNVYRDLKYEFIVPENKLSSTTMYDAVVCCGGFGPGHLSPYVLKHLVEVTKHNGIITFATRFNDAACDYVCLLKKEIDRLQSEGCLLLLNKHNSQYFDIDFHKKEETGITQPLLATIYCCKRL